MRVSRAVVGLVTAAVACTTAPSPPATSVPAVGRVVQLDGTDASIVRDLAVGTDPLLAVAAGGGIWVLDLEDGTLRRIDGATGEVRTVDVGVAAAIASDGTSVLTAADGDRLVTLDGSTGAVTAETRIPGGPHFGLRDAGFPVLVGDEAWITIPMGGDHELWRVDLASGRVRSTVPIGPDPAPPLFAEGAIWVVTGDETVVRVDVTSERVRRIDMRPFPFALAAGGGGVWASTAGRVHLLDPATGTTVRSFEVPGAARGLGWASGALWVTTSTSVVIVNPRDGTIEHETVLAAPSDDEGPIAVVPLGDSVWVTVETV
jgi:outer membrane protein assembly factor BamB